MKAKFKSDFAYGKKITKYMLTAAIILALFSLFFMPSGSAGQFIIMLIVTAITLSTFIVQYKYCRCPYCGKHILVGALKVTVCPKCHRSLDSGKKAKKNER